MYAYVREHANGIARISLILVSFALPFLLLYSISPSSFSRTWTGRTFYLFFMWLVLLEVMLDWERIVNNGSSLKIRNLNSPRTLAFFAFLALPTLYIVVVNFLGGRAALSSVVDWAGIPFASVPRPGWTYGEWVLSLEYLVFTMLFAVIVWFSYRREGLKVFSIALFFLGAIGAVYMIDTLYPFGYFMPLQAFVPLTASLAAGVLNWLGYHTAFTGEYMGSPVLAAYDSNGRLLIQYAVGWPCAGVQSLLIYTFVLLLFLKKTSIPLIQKIIYFAVGALITYGVNVLRIASIYLTYVYNLPQGREAAVEAARVFHSLYGGLYGMSWIVAYPLIIIGSRMLWVRIQTRRNRSGQSPEPTQSETVASSAAMD